MTIGVDSKVPVARNLLHLVVAKAIIIVAIGVVTGYFFYVSEVADYQQGLTMTPASYAANFATYRAGLLDSSRFLWFDLGFVTILCGVVFAMYEGLSHLTAWILRRLLGAHRIHPISNGTA